MKKKHFNKEFVINKENKNLESSTKCWICDNTFVEGDVKVKDQIHVTGKHRGAAYRDCNINISLNYIIPVVFHNLKNYDTHLIMQELGKFNFKINIIPNGLEMYEL